MKKYLKVIIPVLFIGLLGYFGFMVFEKIKHKKEIAENIKTIPSFDYQNIKGGNFARKDLKKETPTIFIYFNSDCEFCNEEAEMIRHNIENFDGIELVFVSFEAPELIEAFATEHQLTVYDNIHFLCDSKITFATTFDVKSLPCLVLYDKNQKLIEKLKGQTKAGMLLRKLGISN